MKITFLILLSFGVSIRSFAQKDSLVFQPVNNRVLQQYNIRNLTTDKEGKLWLSTDRGLLSYDGNDVKVFQHRDGDVNSLSSNDIFQTFVDQKGRLYVLGATWDIDLMDGKTGKVTPLNISHITTDYLEMTFPYVYSDLLADNDSSIWLGAFHIGLIEYNILTKRTESYHLHTDPVAGKNTVYTIKKDLLNDQLLWLGTEDGIYSFNKKTKKLKRNFRCSNAFDSSAADLHTTQMSINSRDTIWFCIPGKGIGCYDMKSGFYTIYPGADKKRGEKISTLDIVEIQQKSENEYYVATEHSLPGIFNTYTHQYALKAVTAQNLPSVLLNHFLVDNMGNFWCVLHNQLFTARSISDKFATLSINNSDDKGQNGNVFKNIVWNKKSKQYYGCFEKSDRIFVFDSSLRVVNSIPVIAGKASHNDLAETTIYDLGMDQLNRLWACGSSLYVYDNTSKKMVASNIVYPRLLFHEQRFQNLIFRGDYLYLQPSNSDYRSIYRINIKSLVYDSIPLPDEIVKDNIQVYQPGKRLGNLLIDKAGRNAYMGYSRNSYQGYINSVIQFDLETRKAKKLIMPNPESRMNIFSHTFGYALDDSGRIWAKDRNGIGMYDTEKNSLINKIDPDPDENIIQLYNIEGIGLMSRLYDEGVLLYDYKNERAFHLTLSDGLISYLNSGIACANNILFVGASNYIQYIPLASVTVANRSARRCYLSSVQVFNQPLQTDTLPQYMHVLKLPHDKNFITLVFSSTEFAQQERLEYQYKLEGVDKDWVFVNYLNRTIPYNDLKPGDYTFNVNIKNADGRWSADGVSLHITIIPAWWQTSVFNILAVVTACILIYLFLQWRIKGIQKREKLKIKYEKELLELEARALRAQMNPHFIFNCMNSIKSLIQQNEQDKAVIYLTTFSKLIRTIFQNSDKREITLFDEMETCRLYTQLESMRFGNKFNCRFIIDDTIDLKSIMVPALIVQPFIENAIWHGIMPKEDGGTVTVSVSQLENAIQCVIDDNGVGREMSKQNKFRGDASTHQSKGVHLTQSRLDLDNLLNERKAILEIKDKKDEHGNPAGTTIIITLTEYQ